MKRREIAHNWMQMATISKPDGRHVDAKLQSAQFLKLKSLKRLVGDAGIEPATR